MMTPRRPRPRLEGQVNPTIPQKQSPYGDGARVVPKKMGMRGAAARKLMKQGNEGVNDNG